MNVQDYKRRLEQLETELSTRAARELGGVREQTIDSAADAGDASLSDEIKSESWSEAQLDEDVLQQVRDALKRIADGSFGRCVVDGEPIEPKRLEAMPWTPYCLKHAQEIEAAERPATPSM